MEDDSTAWPVTRSIENTRRGRLGEGWGEGGYYGSQGVISAWQNLNSERTANTGSGTDSSRLKNWSQVLETEEKQEKDSTDCVCMCVCVCVSVGTCGCVFQLYVGGELHVC